MGDGGVCLGASADDRLEGRSAPGYCRVVGGRWNDAGQPKCVFTYSSRRTLSMRHGPQVFSQRLFQSPARRDRQTETKTEGQFCRWDEKLRGRLFTWITSGPSLGLFTKRTQTLTHAFTGALKGYSVLSVLVVVV